MIKFYDSAGTVHFGQATITRKTSVNGGLSLTGEVFAGNDVLSGLDYGWRLNFDNEKYVITYKKLSDDTNTVVFDAVQQFFWDFAKVALHAQYTGSHKYSFYLGQLFNGSGYTYKNDATVPAFEKENWGYKNKLDLFNDIMDQANVEFEVHNETVHIAKQIGSDLTSFVRKGINLSDLTEEMKISDFATYARGYGAFKDDQDKSKGRLEVEYRSELAKKFGDLEMDPIVDERYTVKNNLIAELKKRVDATYTVSMTMNIYDLESAGYPNYEAPKVGDWILAIDEALNFKRKIRIIKLEEQFDAIGKRIGYTATCGDLNIVDQYTKTQSSLDSKVQSIQESVDSVATSANGKNTNYYGAKEPVNANKGDLWFDQSNSDPDKWTIKQWANGRWEQITLNPGEVDAKVDVAKKEAETATENAKQLAAKYDDTNALANQALDNAKNALDTADSAKVDVTQAKSDSATALDNAKTALTNAKDAQTNANTALDNAKTAQNSADSIKVDVDDVKGTLDSKADKTSVDAVTKRVTTNETNITQNAKDITTKANQTDVDAATKRVSTNETNITQNANSIKSKASQSDVNNLTGRVSSAESSITQNAKDITSKVSSSDVQGMLNDGGYATQTWTGSQIDQKADEISSTVTEVSNKINNMQIGGTNLLTNSDVWSTNDDIVFYNKDLSIDIAAFAGKQLTLSFRFDVDKVTSVSGLKRMLMYMSYYRDDESISVGNCWSRTFKVGDSFHGRISTTITIPEGTNRIGSIGVKSKGVKGNSLKFGRPKVELGTKATDWSPAPEDMATVTAVSNLSQTVDGMKLDISKKIEQKDLNGYATQTWAQNQISATADGINGTLSSVKNTVDGHTTSINDLKADSSGFKSQFIKVDDTLGKQSNDISQLQASATEFNSTLMTVQTKVTELSSISQTVDHIQSTVKNKADKAEVSQVMQTADDIRLSVNRLYTEHTNLVKNSGFVNGEYWSNGADKVWYSIASGIPIAAGTYIGGRADRDNWSFIQRRSDDILASLKGQTVTFSVYARTAEAKGQFRIYIKTTDSDGNKTYFGTGKRYTRDSTAWQRYSITADIPEDVVHMNLTINFLNLNNVSCYASGAMLNLGNSLLPYSEGHGDIVNQINVDSSGILISGKKVMIDSDTYIKNGVIKDAMIANLDASKITAGTLNGNKVNVVNINADNITSGTLDTSNITIKDKQSGTTMNLNDGLNITTIADDGFHLTRIGNGELLMGAPNERGKYEEIGSLMTTNSDSNGNFNGLAMVIKPVALGGGYAGDYFEIGDLTDTKGTLSNAMLYMANTRGSFARKGFHYNRNVEIHDGNMMLFSYDGTINNGGKDTGYIRSNQDNQLTMGTYRGNVAISPSSGKYTFLGNQYFDGGGSAYTGNYGSWYLRKHNGDLTGLHVTKLAQDSSQSIKKDIQLADTSKLSKDIYNLDVTTWKYKTDTSEERHHIGAVIGPDYHINDCLLSDDDSVDIMKVVFGLVATSQQQAQQISELTVKLAALEINNNTRSDFNE